MAVEPEKNEDWLGIKDSEVGEVSSISQPQNFKVQQPQAQQAYKLYHAGDSLDDSCSKFQVIV